MDAGPPPPGGRLLYSEIDLHVIDSLPRIDIYTGEDHLPGLHVRLIVPSPSGMGRLKIELHMVTQVPMGHFDQRCLSLFELLLGGDQIYVLGGTRIRHPREQPGPSLERPFVVLELAKTRLRKRSDTAKRI